MARSIGNRKRNQKAKKGVISQSQRKKTKIQIEKLNELDIHSMDGAELSKALNPENTGKKEVTKSILHTKTLLNDKKKDSMLQKTMEDKKKETDNTMLKQIEMMSGFSL